MPIATNVRQCLSTGQSIDIFYDDTHEGKDTSSVTDTLLMIPGLNNVSYAYDDEFVHLLQRKALEKKGRVLRVIRIDNRDAGKSTNFAHLGQPWLFAASGLVPTQLCPAPHYTLTDMGEDAWALLDRLKIGRAHLWAHSMGGGIIIEMLLLHPERVASLTPSMTSTFHTDSAGPDFRTRLNFLKAPKSNSHEDLIEFKHQWYSENSLAPDAKQHDPRIDEYLRNHHTKVVVHSTYTLGALRQATAINHTRPREPLLRDFVAHHELAGTFPVFIIHGTEDKIVPLKNGERLKEIFENLPTKTKTKTNGENGDNEEEQEKESKAPKHASKFHLQKGMGHFMEPRFWEEISENYIDHVFV